MRLLVVVVLTLIALELTLAEDSRIIELVDGNVSVVGEEVSDAVARGIYGAAEYEAECDGWDPEDGGCDLSFNGDSCPEDFDIFRTAGCFYCNYTNHKVESTRECSGENEELGNEGKCLECATVELTGCIVKS